MLHKNCSTIQKWINLMSIMIDEYKGNGHYITIDSAYMVDIMTQIGSEVWGMNMVGMVQTNQSVADTAETITQMNFGSYESACWQHSNKPWVFTAWGDNNIVKMLSNCHGLEILPVGSGVNRKKRGNNGKRERMSKAVPCLAQQKYYCKTFYLVNKGKGAERPNNMGGKGRTHKRSLKLVFRVVNMIMANAHKI